MTEQKVTLAISFPIKVGRYLQETFPKFTLCRGATGQVCPNLSSEMTSFGFLENGTSQKLGFWGSIFRRTRRNLVGVLSITDQNKDSGVSKKSWSISVYGESNMITMQNIAEHLSEKFDVSVHIKLVDEEIHSEAFDDEFD